MEQNKEMSDEEKELLIILGKLSIFSAYSGEAPSPKKMEETIDIVSKKIAVEPDKIKKAYAYAREKAEEMAFNIVQRKPVGY